MKSNTAFNPFPYLNHVSRFEKPPLPKSISPLIRDKQKVLMLWSSLLAARDLSTFCESNYRCLDQFEIEMAPLDLLQNYNESELDDCSIFFIAYSRRDCLLEGVRRRIESWADSNSTRGMTPVIICRESNTESETGQNWRKSIEELAGRNDARLYWTRNAMPNLPDSN